MEETGSGVAWADDAAPDKPWHFLPHSERCAAATAAGRLMWPPMTPPDDVPWVQVDDDRWAKTWRCPRCRRTATVYQETRP